MTELDEALATLRKREDEANLASERGEKHPAEEYITAEDHGALDIIHQDLLKRSKAALPKNKYEDRLAAFVHVMHRLSDLAVMQWRLNSLIEIMGKFVSKDQAKADPDLTKPEKPGIIEVG